MLLRRGLSLAVLVTASCMLHGPAAGGEPIRLKTLRRILVPAEPNPAEAEAAALLRGRLAALYKLELTIAKATPGQGEPCILVGRAAVAAGLIGQKELDAVKHDGYVVKAADGRIGLAGYGPQGSVYAAWALLRRLGLHSVPWHYGANGGAAERFQPVPDAALPPFTLADKPFFEFRDLKGHLDRGRWGNSLRPFVIGDPSQAANEDLFGRKRKPGYTQYKLSRDEWTDWFHTAPYLIPRDLFYASHPDYFAIHRGKRIPPSRYARSQICTTHPDVLRISIQRALEWVGLQKERRFFCIVPADAALCQCPRCLAQDPLPGHGTDRALAWVNTIAAAVRARHPEKLLVTGAYMETVKPPVKNKPEPNVIVMYCPWYWNSRATSEVSLDSPLNLIAMKELMAWTARFPAQAGIYDYPTACARGTAERIQLYARHGVRIAYFNGPRGSRLHWLGSQLLWDPFQDIERLEADFAATSFGPAAEPLLAYYRLRRETIDRRSAHTRSVFGPLPGGEAPEAAHKALLLLQLAIAAAEQADPETQACILGETLREMPPVLQAMKAAPRDPQATKALVDAYDRSCQRYFALCKQLKLGYLERQSRARFDAAIAKLRAPAPPAKQPEPKTVAFAFDRPDEPGKWLSDGSQAKLISPPRAATLTTPCGDQLRGVRIDAPLSRLPVIPKGQLTIHAGRFYAERTFDPPLDVAGCHALELHLHASRDLPVTLYVNHLHSDIDLHAGEQIVRIDFRNFARSERFDWTTWAKLTRLGIDIWPQDNAYPFPETRDAELTLLAIAATNRLPSPDRLPHRGKAIWLSQFRPNVPRGVAVPRDRYDELMQRQHYKHVGLDYGSKFLHERFRTFTEHRVVSPIYAVLTSDRPPRLEAEAAERIQVEFARATGTTLPLNPPGLAAGPHLGNVVLLGQAAAPRVSQLELDYVGAGGFVLNATGGRIAIAGAVARGATRYLEDHGLRFHEIGPAGKPTPARGMLHELYTLERPFFTNPPTPDGLPPRVNRPATADDVAGALHLAQLIRDAARRGDRTPPSQAIQAAQRSHLARHVGYRLLWNPFADATRMIRDFPKAQAP